MKLLYMQRDILHVGSGGYITSTFKDLPKYNLDLIALAKKTAKKWHEDVNHTYDGKSYFDAHLTPVAEFAIKYIHLIPVKDQAIVIASAYLHDALEDTRKSYNQLFNVFSSVYGWEVARMIADIVYACSNDKGKTREERAGAKYYRGIRNTPYAKFVKIADRLANGTYSKNSKSNMFKKYKNENPHFISALKGTDSIFNAVAFTKYWFNRIFNLEKTDYESLYVVLEELFADEPVPEIKFNYQEIV